MKLSKKLIFPLLLLVVFAACKSNNDSEARNIQLLSDSSAYHNSTSTDSIKMNEATRTPAAVVHHHSETEHSGSVYRNHPSANSGSVSNGPTNTSTQTTQTSTQTTRKKGWSKAAQGAVIGGAAGAVGGAIISKHKVAGAAIGAAVGAAGGYIIGRSKDKKDGR